MRAPIVGTPTTSAKSSLQHGRHLYSRLAKRRGWIAASLGLLALACFVTDLSTGPAHYRLHEVLSALWYGQATQSRRVSIVVWEIRLPVALSALVVGASLSVAGLEMQVVLSNPLASPFTLGLSAAASFGAALGLILGVNILPLSAVSYAIPFNAFLVSMAAALFIHRLSQKRGITAGVIILLGTTLVFTFSALLEALQYVAPDQTLSAVVFWTMGSLSRASWSKLGIMSVVLAFVLLSFSRQAWALTALQLGETRATALGIPVVRLRLRGILLCSLLASVSVAFVGVIGFVGLIGPHIARMLVGEDQRFLLPSSALCGACLLSVASVLSKSLVTGQTLPISIVTSLVGVPLFFALILRTRVR